MADATALVQKRQTTTDGLQTTATIVAANTLRAAIIIQNQSESVLYISLGGTATAEAYDYALKACTTTGDGTGGVFNMTQNTIFTGKITAESSSLSYTVIEL